MLMHNAEIAILFDQMADLLALQEENPFRIRAYRRAAQVIDLSEQKQTRRVLRAMEHRAFTVLSHPLTRLIGERPAVTLDLERICRAAKS